MARTVQTCLSLDKPALPTAERVCEIFALVPNMLIDTSNEFATII